MEDDIYTKYPYQCNKCKRQYEWSSDDIDMAWNYERPFLPCGHSWDALEMVFECEDHRIGSTMYERESM